MTGPTRPAPRGFTLVEMLIVVVLLGILAAVVLPRVMGASAESKTAALLSDLRTVRAQLQLYKAQHLDKFPTTAFVTQLTKYTNASGATRTTPAPAYPLGPYLQAIPKNPVSGIATVRFATSGATRFTAPTIDRGWWFNTITGEFRADLPNSRTTSDGTPMNQL